jgi:hypothetical protein
MFALLAKGNDIRPSEHETRRKRVGEQTDVGLEGRVTVNPNFG